MSSFYACNCIIEKYTEINIGAGNEYPVEFPVWNLQP